MGKLQAVGTDLMLIFTGVYVYILKSFGIYASQTRPHQILYGIPKV